MCECYKIGGKFIAEDPDCEVHGKNGYLDKIEELEKNYSLLLSDYIKLKNAIEIERKEHHNYITCDRNEGKKI